MDRLTTWLDQQKPQTRELVFTMLFDVCAVTVVTLIGTGLVMLQPHLLVTVLLTGSVMGVPIALIGQLVGYRVEDRRTARAKGQVTP